MVVHSADKYLWTSIALLSLTQFLKELEDDYLSILVGWLALLIHDWEVLVDGCSDMIFFLNSLQTNSGLKISRDIISIRHRLYLL
jgi:hypothetical protein